MPDVYNMITTSDTAMVERIARVLEIRAADPQQQRMLRSYLGEIEFPANARVLEVGCGTGAVTRQLAVWPSVAQVVGDGDYASITFSTGDFDPLQICAEASSLIARKPM